MCMPCARGKYKAAGVGACQTCPPGAFADAEGRGVCTPCAAGRFQTIDSDRRSAADCRACDRGAFQPLAGMVGQQACLRCPRGRFGNASAVASEAGCPECADGTFADTEGRDACERCPAGRRGRANAPLANKRDADGACEACPPGRHRASASALPLVGEAACAECGAGSAAPLPGATVCAACDAGRYRANASECAPCPAGLYGKQVRACPPNASASSPACECEACPPGRYSDLAAQPSFAACRLCRANTFQPAEGAASESECIECGANETAPAGTLLPEGCERPLCGAGETPKVRKCVPCLPGSAKPSDGRGECAPCAPGRYASAKGATTCESCPDATYERAGAPRTSATDCVDPRAGLAPEDASARGAWTAATTAFDTPEAEEAFDALADDGVASAARAREVRETLSIVTLAFWGAAALLAALLVARERRSRLARAIVGHTLLRFDFFSLLHLPEDGEVVIRRRTRLGGALSLMFGFALACIALGLGYGYVFANRRLANTLVPVIATKPYTARLALEVTAYGDAARDSCAEGALLAAGFAGEDLPEARFAAAGRGGGGRGSGGGGGAAGCTATLSAPAAALRAERATLEVRFRGHPQLLAWNVSTTLAAPVRVLSGAAGGLAPSGNNTMLVGRSEVELAVRPTEWHDHSGDDDSAVNLTGYALEPRGEAVCEARSPHEAISECAPSAAGASADTAADVSLAFRLARTDTVLVKKREAVRGAADAVALRVLRAPAGRLGAGRPPLRRGLPQEAAPGDAAHAGRRGRASELTQSGTLFVASAADTSTRERHPWGLRLSDGGPGGPLSHTLGVCPCPLG